ncbi:MAG: hypothetical protein ACYDB9_08350 [Gammaproteobacteria bacterium]
MIEPSNDHLVKHLDSVCKRYRGNATQLETAIGMLILGRTMGWRVMYLIHSAGTVRKYEKILGLKIRDTLPEYTEESKRSNAYKLLQIADGIKNFWKVVNGVYPNIKSTQLDEPGEPSREA